MTIGNELPMCCVRLLQLTWRSSKVLSYSINDLDDVQELHTSLKVRSLQALP